MPERLDEPSNNISASQIQPTGPSGHKQSVKVVSDGTPANTHVTVDGEPLGMVTALDYHLEADGLGLLHLELVFPEIDLGVPSNQCLVKIPLPGGELQIPLDVLLEWREKAGLA